MSLVGLQYNGGSFFVFKTGVPMQLTMRGRLSSVSFSQKSQPSMADVSSLSGT